VVRSETKALSADRGLSGGPEGGIDKRVHMEVVLDIEMYVIKC
jgi:hypothetical protein